MVLASLVFFTAGAIVAALSNNFTVLLVGRSIQGIGGGGIITLTDIIVTDLVPLRLRGQWFGFISMSWAIGSVTGPLIGGVFAQRVSWVRILFSDVWNLSNLLAEMDILD
jgi:MFS family permease